ncbi:MAG: PTS sugar transporter subunit IIA [Zetaproteobacteria bacterium]|nr:PTS sugar transporter subunit IIA [Zetaproteobacteria bacterium]
MIGMVIIAHGRLASESKQAIEHVMGELPLLAAIDVINSDASDHLYDEMSTVIKQCDTGSGVLVFVDMFGGTPCNIALGSLGDHACEVISGFSLPSLIKAATLRKSSRNLAEIAAQSIQAGHQYMRQLSEDTKKGLRL